jgi:hypothetical protein
MAVFIDGLLPLEDLGAARARQRPDRALELVMAGKLGRLARPRAEPGTPKQASRLGLAEITLVDRYACHLTFLRRFVAEPLVARTDGARTTLRA